MRIRTSFNLSQIGQVIVELLPPSCNKSFHFECLERAAEPAERNFEVDSHLATALAAPASIL